jgi:hydroxymethylbilane synthase
VKLRIATRKSALALWQAEHVAALLRSLDEIDEIELVPLSTRGDEILDRSLQKIGGKGLFIKELEVAMAEERADLAVHSMKDVPVDMPDGFTLAATLERANPADALVSRSAPDFDALKTGAIIGSSSLRRQAQLKCLRPDLEVIPLRGNVNTRLAKLEAGDYDAIILAAAGLERLDLAHHITQLFSPTEMLPAAAQGVLGIECREDRADIIALLGKLECSASAATCAAERAVARRFGASCQSPVAAFAEIDGDEMSLSAFVAVPDGSETLRDRITGPSGGAEQLGLALADRMLAKGAREILDRAERLAADAPDG